MLYNVQKNKLYQVKGVFLLFFVCLLILLLFFVGCFCLLLNTLRVEFGKMTSKPICSSSWGFFFLQNRNRETFFCVGGDWIFLLFFKKDLFYQSSPSFSLAGTSITLGLSMIRAVRCPFSTIPIIQAW